MPVVAAAAAPRKGKTVQATVRPWLVQTEVRSLAARASELNLAASGIYQSAVLLRCLTEEAMMSLV